MATSRAQSPAGRRRRALGRRETGVGAGIGVNAKIRVDVNGVRQSMVIRGEDRTNPVLLWVHGGPGMPDYFLTRRYPTGLEDLFTIVWWDQRGAGLSYDPRIPRDSMTIEQFVADTLTVTDFLRARFHREKIYLLGHSWGSFIAIQAAAQAPDRYHGYVGMAQMVHQLESEKLAHDYMLATYRRRGDAGMVRRLEAAPVSLSGGTPEDYLAIRDKAMHGLGIGTTHDMKSVITGIFLRSLLFPEYTAREKIGLWRGRAFSRSFGLWDQFIRVDLRQDLPRLNLPAYFLHGAFDLTCSYRLALDYFHKLDTPVKGFYRFADSAHSPILEEPSLARAILGTDVLAGVNSLSSG